MSDDTRKPDHPSPADAPPAEDPERQAETPSGAGAPAAPTPPPDSEAASPPRAEPPPAGPATSSHPTGPATAPGSGGGGSAPPPPPAGAGFPAPGSSPPYGSGSVPATYRRPAAGGPHKPSKVTAIAVLDLVDGILNILIGLAWVFGAFVFGASTLGCGCLLLPLGAYPLILGVLEIVYASQLLPSRPVNVGPARWLGVLQILGVLYGQVVSVVAGVLKLVFAEDPEVRDYLERTRTARADGGTDSGSGYGA